MILDKIIKLFKKEDTIRLYDQRDILSGTIARQYISSGCACYLLENLPIFNDRTLPSLLGADPEKITANYSETDVPDWLQKAFTPRPTDDDIPLKDSGFEMFGYAVFQGDTNGFDTCVFVKKEYLAPLSDNRPYTYFYRPLGFGNRAVVAMDGFFVQAVIMPVKLSGAVLEKYKNFASAVYAELCRLESTASPEPTQKEDEYDYVGEL